MKDIDMKATCPYKADVKCDAAANLLCDDLCVYHPRYVDDGSNMNFKTHRCPYRESTTCSGETCGEDCSFHPEYDEEDKPIKKIDRPDLDFDIDEDECILLKDKKNWKNGLSPCVGCERECPITAGMTELTYDDGYEQAMIDCRDGAETSYLDGYKDCFYGEPPAVEDDEIREILLEQPKTSLNYMKNAGIETLYDDLCVSGKILHMVEDAKKSLFEVRKQIYSSSINKEEQRALALSLFKVADLLDKVQHQYASDEMYRFLGYM